MRRTYNTLNGRVHIVTNYCNLISSWFAKSLQFNFREKCAIVTMCILINGNFLFPLGESNPIMIWWLIPVFRVCVCVCNDNVHENKIVLN